MGLCSQICQNPRTVSVQGTYVASSCSPCPVSLNIVSVHTPLSRAPLIISDRTLPLYPFSLYRFRCHFVAGEVLQYFPSCDVSKECEFSFPDDSNTCFYEITFFLTYSLYVFVNLPMTVLTFLYQPMVLSCFIYLPMAFISFIYLPMAFISFIYLPMALSSFFYLPMTPTLSFYLPTVFSSFLYLPLAPTSCFYLPITFSSCLYLPWAPSSFLYLPMVSSLFH